MPHNKTLPEGLHPDTLAVRIASEKSQYGEHSEALFLTSSFIQPDAATAARRFAMEEDGYTYTRVGNPTVSSLEMRLAALEGTEAAIATSTGMAAILLLGMGLLKNGDHVVCSQSVFGSTIRLFAGEFSKWGITTSFVSQTDVAAWPMWPTTPARCWQWTTAFAAQLCNSPSVLVRTSSFTAVPNTWTDRVA